MKPPEPLTELVAVANSSGLLAEGSSGVALISGGPDSACLAAALAEVCTPARVEALHINYGLRETADRDERCCRDLCAALRIDLHVERPRLAGGNVQAAARDVRYEAGERLRDRLDADWIATGHTRTDLAETVIYRLASSPGRRALLGLPSRRGRVIRPLLELSRSDTRRLAEAAGLPFADDPTNADLEFARNRIRAEVLPALEAISPEAERNIAETRAVLAEEGAMLERLAEDALDEAGAGGGASVVQAADLAQLDPALRRIALQRLAERVAGQPVPMSRARAADIWRLASEPEGGELALGAGVRAVCEHSLIRFDTAQPDVAPPPIELSVPGAVRFGRWDLQAEVRSGGVEAAGPEVATLDAAALGEDLVVRAWRDGDRMRPLGLDGTKSLQDLFTDRRVPRSLRRTLPIVTAGDRVAWVAGVAVAEEFRISAQTGRVTVLTARARH
jgi:tRNA(Ile)-lysidine synthase